MKRNIFNTLSALIVALLCALCFNFAVSAADKAAAKDPLRGIPFSDPKKIFKMSDEWMKAPIKYESWAKGADIAVALDQQIYPALLPLIREYEKQNGLKIAVEEGTCGIAAGAVSKKTVDISGMCCPPGEVDRLPGLKYLNLGIGSLAILVNKDNPVENISTADLRNIFRGKVDKWSQLKTDKKAQDIEIKPIIRLHCKNRPGHWCLLLGSEDLFSPRAMDVGSIADMLTQVASVKGAVGYETLWMVEHNNKNSVLKALSIDGYSPYDNSALISGKYNIYRTFNITVWNAPNLINEKAAKLVDYIIKNLERIDKSYYIVPATELRKAGWKFDGNELVGEPF
ncbi:MAG: substrate-binding domain-containing protein [Nitrospirae bacterium]|nr:substrate-binding domain-containing protein [Nitrospirota bacterium]MBF0535376.1 substrate-binding domain-containing protein [Nitrospirota bacterium]MBF0616896.1 substrate-binding domain-containing protein [Nitrospirota bacterium]